MRLLPGWTVNIGLDTHELRRMETKAHIQRKGLNLEARGFKVSFRPDLKERNQITVSFKKVCLDTLLKKPIKIRVMSDSLKPRK